MIFPRIHVPLQVASNGNIWSLLVKVMNLEEHIEFSPDLIVEFDPHLPSVLIRYHFFL